MATAGNPELFPRLAPWIISFASASADAVVRSAASSIARALTIQSALPETYVWLFHEQDTLDNAIRSSKTGSALNFTIWENVGRNCEAFQVTSVLKGIELLKSTVRSLNLKEFVPAAVLARALLETATHFTDKTTFILKNIRLLEFRPGAVTFSPEFEQEVTRTIFGTRLVEDEFKDFLRQFNIEGSIKRLAKSPHPEHQELQRKYALLCDVTHPNVLGNARFWSHVEGVDQEGRKRVVMNHNAEPEVTRLVTENALWALSWSAGMVFQSFEDMNEAKLTLETKLKGK